MPPEVTNTDPYPVDDGTKIADAARANNRDREFARGKILFKAKSSVATLTGEPLMPPRLVVLQNGKYQPYGVTNDRTLATPFFYSGVMAIGTFNFVGYTGMGGGVTAYLNEVLSLNTGDRIGGGVDPEEKYGSADKFAQYTGHVVVSYDPTEGMTAGLV